MFMLISFLLLALLSLILLALGLSLSLKAPLDREKSSPFECGFSPKSSSRLPFSIRFFMISIIFLIFDVELILIFPLIPALTASFIFASFLSVLVLVGVLILGLAHEIFQGSLAWAN